MVSLNIVMAKLYFYYHCLHHFSGPSTWIKGERKGRERDKKYIEERKREGKRKGREA